MDEIKIINQKSQKNEIFHQQSKPENFKSDFPTKTKPVPVDVNPKKMGRNFFN